MTTDYRAELQRLVKAYDDHGGNWPEDEVEALRQAVERACAFLSQPKSEGPPLEPRELIRALELAEAALADIGEAEREPGDDLAWAEARAAQDLPRIRIALDRWGRPATTTETP